jgi:bla regulator protein blaR1
VIRTRGLGKIDAEWRLFVNKIAARMGVKRKVQVWLSHLVDSPVTIGYLKPIILLPVAAISHLSTQQVEAIILHELSHIRRFDYLFNLIINFIRTALYFNPFVSAFVRNIEKEREKSCDELVIQFQYKPHEYASALLMLQKNWLTEHTMMLAAAKTNDLLARVESILGIKKRSNYSFRRLAGAIAILVCMLSMNAFLFLNNQKKQNGFYGFAQGGYNPYYFMGGADASPTLNTSSEATSYFVTAPKPATTKPAERQPMPDLEVLKSDPGYFYNVNYTTPVIPELMVEEEQKVKGTVEATRKILEEKQWKEVENSYADALNSYEKAHLKNQYIAEVNKINWKDIETKLRFGYDNIDWPKIDQQLALSLAEIKLDSVKGALKIALNDLVKLENYMKENELTSIPDTDITLKLVQDVQNKAKAQITKVKAARVTPKKIVRI